MSLPFNPDLDGRCTWNGATFTLTKQVISSSPSTGIGLVEVYRGTKSNVLAALAALPYGASAIVDHEGPVWRIEVTFSYSAEFANGQPDDGTLSSAWELLPNDLQRDIRELPKYAILGADMLSQIDKALAGEGDAYKTLTYEQKQKALLDYGTAHSINTSDDQLAILSLFFLLTKKTVSYGDSQYVLRNRKVIGSQATFRVAFENSGRLLTTDQLQSANNIPSNLLFEIQNIPAPDSSFIPASYKYSWLKKTPTVRQISRGFFEASTEWWLETWSTDIYPLAT